MIPETLILVPVRFVIVPEVLFSVVNVVTPLMDIPIVDVLPAFKTVCSVGFPASPVKFDPSPKYVTIPDIAVTIPEEIRTFPSVEIPE